jgi:hypothetical protein
LAARDAAPEAGLAVAAAAAGLLAAANAACAVARAAALDDVADDEEDDDDDDRETMANAPVVAETMTAGPSTFCILAARAAGASVAAAAAAGGAGGAALELLDACPSMARFFCLNSSRRWRKSVEAAVAAAAAADAVSGAATGSVVDATTFVLPMGRGRSASGGGAFLGDTDSRLAFPATTPAAPFAVDDDDDDDDEDDEEAAVRGPLVKLDDASDSRSRSAGAHVLRSWSSCTVRNHGSISVAAASWWLQSACDSSKYWFGMSNSKSSMASKLLNRPW